MSAPGENAAGPGRPLPEVDVTVLSWNRAELTVAAIESALAQQGVAVKVWVVDQGSSPAELEKLRAAVAGRPNVSLEELGRNLGVAGGRNRAMRQGNAPVVVGLDNDAEFASPDSLRDTVERFERNPRLAVIGFRILNAFTGRDDEQNWVYPKALKASRDRPFPAGRFAGGGHALRRSALARTDLYDERLFFYWEETDLSCQLIERGFEIVYDPGIVILHKSSPEGRVDWGGRRFYFLVRNALYLRHKYFGSPVDLAARAAGYAVKGAYNGVLGQALRGILDAVPMCLQSDRKHRLGRAARDYLWEVETRHRGSLLQRLRSEVLARLPGQDG